MQHAFTRLSEELRILVDTWRALRIDVSLENSVRANIERQAKGEITQTWDAMKLITRQGYGPIPMDLTKSVTRILKPESEK